MTATRITMHSPAISAPQPLLASAQPSHTAWLCGISRARHQLLDAGAVFKDELALDILGPEEAKRVIEEVESDGPRGRRRENGSISQAMRGGLAARSRIAEDTLTDAVAAGATQYVLLGAGLDTFALRNRWPRGLERVFEVDHPATQVWKRQLVERAGLKMPAAASYVPVDFEQQDFVEQLIAHGWQPGHRTVFSWLGVTMYLAPAAVETTLARIGAMAAPGSMVVFDYLRRPAALDVPRRLGLRLMARRFRRMGEPWRCFIGDQELQLLLLQHGFEKHEFISPRILMQTLLAPHTPSPLQRALGGIMGGVVRVRVSQRSPKAAAAVGLNFPSGTSQMSS